MFKLNKKVDYAIVILSHLATVGKVISATEIASSYQLSRPLAANILKQLTQAGFVTSTRGAKGGYGLAQAPETITIGDVVRAIDGEFALTECTVPYGDGTNDTTCEIAGCCPVRLPLQYVHDRVSRVLDELTFAEITQPVGTRFRATAAGVQFVSK